MKKIGESISAHHMVGAQYPGNFKKTIKEKDYISQLIFNLDVTGMKF
jgi:hypothetical protein